MVRQLAVASMAAMLMMAPGAWAQSDAAVGTWKLNVAKSTFKPGPAPKDGTLTFEQDGKGLKSVQSMTSATGEKTSGSYAAQYDGKDYPIKGSATADTVSLKFGSGNTVQRIDKKGGKIVSTYMRSISADGKTMTVTQKGTNAKGEPVENMLIFDRQK